MFFSSIRISFQFHCSVLIKDYGFVLDGIKRHLGAVRDAGIRLKIAKVSLVTTTRLSCVGLVALPRLTVVIIDTLGQKS